MLERFTKFGELSWNEQLLFSEAFFLQLTIGLLLKIIPFRWIPKLFSSPQSAVLSQQSAVSSQQSAVSSQQSAPNTEYRIPYTEPLTPHPSRLYQIKTAIQRASKISLWKNKCLIQSLAARRMLNRRKIPSQLSLGVAKGENGKMIAHAWLKAGDFEIVEKAGDFSELYLF